VIPETQNDVHLKSQEPEIITYIIINIFIRLKHNKNFIFRLLKYKYKRVKDSPSAPNHPWSLSPGVDKSILGYGDFPSLLNVTVISDVLDRKMRQPADVPAT
jgi:hypothetical protein